MTNKELIPQITRLLFSIAALVLAFAVLVFAVRPAFAVATNSSPLPTTGVIHTQSADGTILYQWEWDNKARHWNRAKHDTAAK
jgi:hypothetical protein